MNDQQQEQQAPDALNPIEPTETPQAEATPSSDELATETPDETTILQNEIAEWKDKYARLMADFDNFRKRSNKERIETIQTAGKDVIVSMLDVLDDSERAEAQMAQSADIEALKEGTQLVFNKLRNTLQQKGLKAFNSKGEAFDVEKHEALTEIVVPGMEGKVVDEMSKGYLLNDKLIRHAKVVVGKSNDA
jgi:molecular chaperone GrpE